MSGENIWTRKKTICPYDCPASCGLLAETDGRQIRRVTGDPENPVFHGQICGKMGHYERSVHSADRILTPLRRSGKKGSGEFVPVTWEEALSEIGDRWKRILKEDGGEAILPVSYSGVMSLIQRWSGDAFFNRMGARQMTATLCSSAKKAAHQSVFGKTGCLDPRELADSDFLLIWGSDVKATRIHTMKLLANARRAGRPVVLVEACARDMADFCDEVFLVRPGTDGALALAMMHVLAEEGLADEDFLRNRAEGYEEFRKTLPSYTPEWAQEITGIPAERIRKLAENFGAAKAPAILLGSGPSRRGNGGMNCRLIMILSAFTGAWGRPGGGYCGSDPNEDPYVDVARIKRPDFRKKAEKEAEERRAGTGKKKAGIPNLNLLGEALCCWEPGEIIRSVYIYGSNPALSVSDQKAVFRGLAREDLFTVVHERFMTDTARYADVILPATFSVEQADCYGSYGYCSFGTAYPVVPPPGECKSNWDTFCLLARTMGYEEEHFGKTAREMLQELLDHPREGLWDISPEDWKVLREGGVITTSFADHSRFLTESGKMRIVDAGLDVPVPCYQEDRGGAEPLCLVAVPSMDTLNSVFLDREDLILHRGPATILLHPVEAEARQIADGDPVIAENDLAAVPFRAKVTELVAPGTAAVAGVFASVKSPHMNALTHSRLSDIGEATTLNGNTVEVRRGG